MSFAPEELRELFLRSWAIGVGVGLPSLVTGVMARNGIRLHPALIGGGLGVGGAIGGAYVGAALDTRTAVFFALVGLGAGLGGLAMVAAINDGRRDK